MRLTAFLAVAALSLAVVPRAQAVPVKGLYDASVPVSDQNPESRDPALRRALQVVLFRVTGTRNLPPEVSSTLLPRAATLVQGYGYEQASSGQALLLHAQFDARATATALRGMNLPVWGANRPSHLVWIALRDDGQSRVLLDAAGVASRAPALASAADTRGLPFTFPAVDASERKLVTFDQVWANDLTGVLGASRHYGADQIVVARVGKENGRWLARWALLNGSGAVEEWAATRETLDEALAAGVDELADREAQRFATSGTTAQELELHVSGVASLDDYGHVLNYLRALNAVRSAQVQSAEGDQLTLRLRVEGDPAAIARAIASGSTLRELPDGRTYTLIR